jgi:hypothetical protein
MSGHVSSEDHKDDLESPDHIGSDEDGLVSPPDTQIEGEVSKKEKNNLLSNAAAGYQTLYKTTVTDKTA